MAPVLARTTAKPRYMPVSSLCMTFSGRRCACILRGSARKRRTRTCAPQHACMVTWYSRLPATLLPPRIALPLTPAARHHVVRHCCLGAATNAVSSISRALARRTPRLDLAYTTSRASRASRICLRTHYFTAAPPVTFLPPTPYAATASVLLVLTFCQRFTLAALRATCAAACAARFWHTTAL